MITTTQKKLDIINKEINEDKTDGICHCPKELQLIVYNYAGKKVKSGICKRCLGKIESNSCLTPQRRRGSDNKINRDLRISPSSKMKGGKKKLK